MNYGKPTDFEEKIGRAVVHAAYTIHKTLEPGLLERIYQVCMEHELKKIGFDVKRKVNIPICYDGILFDEGLRLDLLINDRVIVELKAVDQVNPIWKAQIISPLKLSQLRLGNLINFNVPLINKGIKRVLNTKQL